MTPPPTSVTAVASSAPPTRVIVIALRGGALRDLLDALAPRGFHRMHEFPDLGAAAAALEREAADIALVEIGPDGEGTLAKLRSHPVLGESLPFIVIDQTDRDDLAHFARKAGAQDYLAKSTLTPARLERAMLWSLDRARRERSLRSESDLLHALLDYLPDKIYFKDRRSRFVRASKSVAEWFRVPQPADLIGRSDFDFYTPEHAEATFADEQEVIRSGEPIIGRIRKRTLPDGRAEWSSTTKLPLRDRRGRIVGTFGVTRDLTPLKQLEAELAEERNRLRDANAELSAALDRLQRAHEELHGVQLQLIEAEKLRSIGRLAAGVAHEVKNPLAIISMGVEFLRSRHGEEPTTAGVLHDLADAVARADAVIKGLLDFSAPRRLELAPHDLNGILRTALRLVRGEIKPERHHVETALGDIPPALVDRAKVCQVLVNIFTNALHAMPDGGTLTIRTRAEQVTGVGTHAADAQGEPFRPGDPVVVVEIDDTGEGIPPALLGRVFDPFVTTKTTGKGTGLGMSVAKSIMSLHHGTITLENRAEGGARATLVFHASPAENHEPPPRTHPGC